MYMFKSAEILNVITLRIAPRLRQSGPYFSLKTKGNFLDFSHR